MKTAFAWFSLLLALVPLALSGSPIFRTTTFKQNVTGYTGTRQVEITDQYIASWNCNNGVTYADPPYANNQFNVLTGSAALFCSASVNSRFLVRWENLASLIPANSLVSSAAVQIRVVQWNMIGQCPITINHLSKGWSFNANEAIANCYRIGWSNNNKVSLWTAPGALSDVQPGFSATVTPTVSSANGQLLSASLNPNAVQSWLSSPSANYGLIFSVTNRPGCQPAVQTYPVLSVTYTCPAGFLVSAEGTVPAVCNAVACPATGYQGTSPSCTCAAGYIGCGWDGTSDWLTPTTVPCPAGTYQGTSPSCSCAAGYIGCGWDAATSSWINPTAVPCPSVGYQGTSPACVCDNGYIGCGWDGSANWVAAQALSCSYTDAQSAGGSFSAVLGSSFSVTCNPGYFGGGTASCVAGSGPTVQTVVNPCTAKACHLDVYNSEQGSYQAALGGSVTVTCLPDSHVAGVATCAVDNNGVVAFDSTPSC